MNLRVWAKLVDLATIRWLATFSCGLVVKNESSKALCELATLGLLPIFVFDLTLLFRQERSFMTFLRKRWVDILLVIPYFRIFRLLRFAKLLKLLKAARFKRTLDLTRFAKKAQRLRRDS